MRTIYGLAFALGLLVSSCACDNAILEVAITVPARDTDYTDMIFRAQVVEPGLSLDEIRTMYLSSQLAGGDPEVIPLQTASRSIQLSVVGQAEDVGRDVLVRAIFCNGDCSAVGPARPEHAILIRRPLYTCERTVSEWVIPAAPSGSTPLDEVPRCSVRGCTSSISDTFFCVTPGDESSPHFCD